MSPLAFYLPTGSTHHALLGCAILTVVATCWALSWMMRPRTNRCCLFGMACFCTAWLVDGVAHSMVELFRFPTDLARWGVWMAAALFSVGFVTSFVGVVIHLRNEHRYDRGFGTGVIASALNGWVVANAVMTLIAGRIDDLAQGLVIPLFALQSEPANEPVAEGSDAVDKLLKSPSSDEGVPLEVERKAARKIAFELIEVARSNTAATWQEMPLGDAELLATMHPQAQALLFSPEGPGWLSLSVQRAPRIDSRSLPQLAEAACTRIVTTALDSARSGAARDVIGGFETSRLRYLAILPTLPGPHAFDHWCALGQGWFIEIVIWTPSASAPLFQTESLAVVSSMLRVAAGRGLAGPPRDPQSEKLFQSGSASFADEDFSAALADWTHAAELAPDDVEIALSVSRTYERLDRPGLALQALERRRPFLRPSPVLDAAVARLQARAGNPQASGGFEELFDAGYSDDSLLTAALAFLTARGDAPAAAALLDECAPRHGSPLVLEWRARLLAAATPPAAPAAIPAPPPQPGAASAGSGGPFRPGSRPHRPKRPD